MDIKDRLLYFLKLQNIKRVDFTQKTGLSSSFLDKKGGISSVNLEAISECFPILDLDWLVTGKGEMLRKTDPEDNPADNPLHIDIEAVKLLIAEKDRTIAKLEEQLATKDQQIDRLIHALSTHH